MPKLLPITPGLAQRKLDLFIGPKRTNAERLLEALKSFFNADTGYEVDEVIQPGTRLMFVF